MYRKSMRLFVVPVVALLLMAVSSDANAGTTIKRIVKCDKGMSVQHILDSNIFSLPMELKLVGTCDSFEITKDYVSIAPLHNHSCPGATVEGWIAIEGAHGIKLSCLEVVGPDGGVLMFGGQALLEDVHISGNSDAGIEMSAHAMIEVIGGSITNHGDGVALESGHAVFEDVEISNNASGVRAENNSYVEFGGGTVMNNGEYGISIGSSSVFNSEYLTVSNNGRNGIIVSGNSRAEIFDTVITDHTRSGLVIADNSSVRWGGGKIAENDWHGIFVASHSMAQVQGGAEIVNNKRYGIRLTLDAGVNLRQPAKVWGNWRGPVQCEGKESSIQFDPLVEMEPISLDDCPDIEF